MIDTDLAPAPAASAAAAPTAAVRLTIARGHVGVDQRADRIVPGWNLLMGVNAILLVTLVVQVHFVGKLIVLVARTHASFRTSRGAFSLWTASFLASLVTTTSATTPTPPPARPLPFFPFASRGAIRTFQPLARFITNLVPQGFVIEFLAYFDMVEPFTAELSALAASRSFAARPPPSTGAPISACSFAAGSFTGRALASRTFASRTLTRFTFLAATATPTSSPPPTATRFVLVRARRACHAASFALILAQSQVRGFVNRVIDVLLVLVQFHIATPRTSRQWFRLVALAPRRTGRRFAEGRSAG